MTHTKGSGPDSARGAAEKNGARAKEADRKNKRAQITQAAYRCFSRGGYHKTTVDKICSALGISKGAFYWYFEGKQDVFLTILEEWARRVQADMARQFHDALGGPEPGESVTRSVQSEARRVRHFMPIWLEFLAQVPRVPKIREGLARFHRRIRSFITNLLDPVLPKAFDEADREALSTMLLACFIGLVCQELVDPKGASSREVVPRFMKVFRYFVETPEAYRFRTT